MNKIYRTDIDGLRAFAVISVILYHLGYINNGYLGVDIFFVISGYLITGIIYREVINDNFSILNFYERRIRRIIPLVLFTTAVSFILGIFFMLPDDLENLSQSVFASNLSLNNILMYITSADYWALRNDYKPLMHTWSLGVEEQFYIFYPFIFFFLKKNKIKYILPTLIILTILSFSAFLLENNIAAKFYFIQYRFFELSIGGIASIYFNSSTLNYKSNKSHYFLLCLLMSLGFILLFPIKLDNDIKVILVTFISTGVLVLGDIYYEKNKTYKNLFSNKLISNIGKISFSIYMWHQIVFAFARYIKVNEMSGGISIILVTITILLSIVSYNFIENTFRNRKLWKTKNVLISLSIFFLLITGSSFYVYSIGGVVKDVPELNLKFEAFPEKMNFFSKTNNIQIHYNENVRLLDEPFSKSNKIKVLVVGSSYGRDFVNILLESTFIGEIEVKYFESSRVFTDNSIKQRVNNAKHVFFTDGVTREYIKNIEKKYNIIFSNEKLKIVGVKDFGYSNGIIYNSISSASFDQLTYRTHMKKGFYEKNKKLKSIWGIQYIDLIELIIDPSGKVLVFTPDMKFISQDTGHLTKFGAMYFANLLEEELLRIMNTNKVSGDYPDLNKLK
jgi:peptidoglycan/LPS O-acetylase OafA/YrhL